MKKLTKKAYNKLVEAKVLQTGLFNGSNVEAAEINDELFEHLQDIKLDYRKGLFTLLNVDAEIAYNYFKNEDEFSDNLDLDYGFDDFYGSYDENMKDIKTHFGY